MGVITRVQLLGGTAPLKFGSAKNAQNLVHLTTTFDFSANISELHRDINKR